MRLFVSFVFVMLLVSGCGDDVTAGCSELREPEDPLSIQHVIDVETASYLTDPPTSGPHAAIPAMLGLLDDPLPPSSQVRVLEVGGVVVQYEDPAARTTLRTLLDDSDVALAIAPADSLPAPVVVTAWTWKLSCESADLDAIREFMSQRPSDAPGQD